MANIWTYRGDTFADLPAGAVQTASNIFYKGAKAKEIWYHGRQIWGKKTFRGGRIVLILDDSGSMSGTPMQSLKDNASQFCQTVLESLGGKIAIVSIGNPSVSADGFTGDVAALQNTIAGLHAAGGTYTGSALRAAADYYAGLTGAEANLPQLIILFSDGVPSYDGAWEENGPYTAGDTSIYAVCNAVYNAALSLKNDGKTIMTMYYSANGSSGFPQRLMTDLASSPGYAFSSGGSGAIDELFDAIEELLAGGQ